MAVGQIIFITDGTLQINVLVTGISGNLVVFSFQHYPTDSAAGTIAAGASVVVGGRLPLTGTIPGQITDNTGGIASSTLSGQTGIYTLPFFVNLADISAAATTIINTYQIGHAFQILSSWFVVEKAATTGGKAVTLTPSISGVAITGGVLSLTSANCTPQGHVINGTGITGLNAGSVTDTLSINSSANTVFIEGSGWIIFRIQNMDTANALATIASKVNSLIAAL